MKIIKGISLILMVIAAAYVLVLNYTVRFTHPEYTETMLFLSCWKPNLWCVISIICGLFVTSRPDTRRVKK